METPNIENVPNEMLEEIILRIPYKDVLRLCQASKLLDQRICHNDDLWRIKAQKDFSAVMSGRDQYIIISFSKGVTIPGCEKYIPIYSCVSLAVQNDIVEYVSYAVEHKDFNQRDMFKILQDKRNYQIPRTTYYLLDKYFTQISPVNIDTLIEIMVDHEDIKSLDLLYRRSIEHHVHIDFFNKVIMKTTKENVTAWGLIHTPDLTERLETIIYASLSDQDKYRFFQRVISSIKNFHINYDINNILYLGVQYWKPFIIELAVQNGARNYDEARKYNPHNDPNREEYINRMEKQYPPI